jgi:spermidine synthase
MDVERAKRKRKKRRRRQRNIHSKKLKPWDGPGPRPPLRVRGKRKLLHETRSPYSHIRVRQTANRRALVFVQDGGTEWPQTIMNVEKPHEPVMPYQRAALVGLLHRPAPRRALVVGLGGGTLLSMLHHVEPKAHITAVEIDPEVVRIAADWFSVKPGPGIDIVTADGVAFLESTKDRWDLIIMDVFLEPSAEGTDSSGVPRTMKTEEFLSTLRGRLTPDGVVVFNLHNKSDMPRHRAAIEKAFKSVVLYRAANSGNRIAVASPKPAVKPAVLLKRVRALEGTPAGELMLEEILGETP